MKFLSTSTALLALARSHFAAAATVQPDAVKAITLDIVNRQLAPDGHLRSTIVANGQYPGPLLTATKGQTLQVTVNNKLTDPSMRRSTTVSFDGIFQTTANAFNEGSAFVTTCPISPGRSYTYTVPLGQQAGTFWYHSELSVQYVDGLRGALIVYDPLDPHAHLYDVDDESTVVQIGDWWQNSTLPMLAGYEATGIVPVSDSGTINGKGRFQGGPAVPFAVINVVRGKRYRLRFINQSARNVFTMSIDNHPLTIIEADGENTQPHTVDTIEMLAGMRYSVVINANQPVANYWINAPFVGGDPARNPHQNATLSRAVLRYKGAPNAEPTTPMTTGPANGTALVEADLRPLVATKPSDPDITLSLNLVVVAGKAIWNINNISYLPPKVPTLEQVMEGAVTAADFQPTENTFVFPPNKTVEITFPPTDDDDAHPFHMHGGNFWLVKSMSSPNTNLINPIRRDISGVGGTGTTIRFVTDHAGPWMFHCHIFWHKQAGLATVLLTDPAATRKVEAPSAAWQALCPTYNALPPDQQ